MKVRLALILSVLMALSLAATSTARAHQIKTIKPLAKLPLKGQARVLLLNIKHAQATIRWWHSIKGNWAFDLFRYPAAFVIARRDLRYHTNLLHNATRKLEVVNTKLTYWLIPHHNLWICIHGGEGRWTDHDSGSNGHYGGLQMSPNWLGYFRGTADQFSQFQQERFAEQGYRDSGYSHNWLQGQWGQTIGPCWKYA